MNKQTPQSPGSVVSSESESHSVSDENSNISTPLSSTAGGNSKQQKSLKKLKEEEKRPPWKPASISPVIKSDASALIKARLLDASRRVIRAAKFHTVGVQTEPERVILMREVFCETNPIQYRDASVVTAGNLIVRNTGCLILTHSIAQMTDLVQSENASTQTAMPRNSVSFCKYLNNYQNMKKPQIISTEKQLNVGADTTCVSNDIQPDKFLTEITNDPGSEIESKIFSHPTPDLISAVDGAVNINRTPFLSVPTLSSWQDMDFPNDEEDIPTLPRRTQSEGSKPWSDFKNLVLGERLQNMRLSPIQCKPKPTFNNQKHVTWSDSQIIAVSALLNEASALIEIVDRVSIILGPNVKLNKVTEPENFEMSPPKWSGILKESCNLLEEQLKKLNVTASEAEKCVVENLSNPEFI